MSGATIDLYSAQFWWVAGLAIVALNGLTRPAARSWAQAAINLGVLVLLLRGSVAPVLCGVLSAWLALKAISRGGVPGKVALAAIGLADLALFVAHKLGPASLPAAWAGPAEAILTAVGFSYVALRLVDVARAVADGRQPPPSLPATVNYLLPFHMLVAGPIQSYDDFVAQPAVPPPPGVAGSLAALESIAAGLFKKYVLAALVEGLFLTGLRAPGPYLLLEVQLNYVWLYLDFSAYSDVALGVGRLMGVATPVNFDRPLLARNMIDYWERWHISLSQFIRRHVFIPVQLTLTRAGGGTRPLLTASIAFTVSFLLCGLWHNLGPRWLAWGALHAAGLVVCNAYRASQLKRLGRKGLNAYYTRPWPRVLGIVLTFEFAAIALAVATYPYQEIAPWTSPGR
jgi:D-alanyl-lipoteichoic acid acyltransferase DltB (MBOAT superfamily)